MQWIVIRASRVSLLALSLALPTASLAVDTDGDGVDDAVDNCLEWSNPAQEDGDGDGCGDICDGDFDQSGEAGAPDLAAFLSRYTASVGDAAYDAAYDFDKNETIEFLDWQHFYYSTFLTPGGLVPGPSLVTGRDPVACP